MTPTSLVRSPLAEAVTGKTCVEILMLLASVDSAAAVQAFPNFRLTRLIEARFDMGPLEASIFLKLCGAAPMPTWLHADAAFHRHLLQTLDRYGLASLFVDDAPGGHHHAMRPRGYDYSVDAVDPQGMETWRADYRRMQPAQQMLVASLIWLYRGGKDHVWLRRVPCTWQAADALRVLGESGALPDWGRLIFLFPGW
jgi:hypothetical protein